MLAEKDILTTIHMEKTYEYLCATEKHLDSISAEPTLLRTKLASLSFSFVLLVVALKGPSQKPSNNPLSSKSVVKEILRLPSALPVC